MIQNPVIVIPGITATELHDDYPLKTEDVWTMVFNKEYERIALHPDDIRYEAIEPAHVFPGRAFSITTKSFSATRSCLIRLTPAARLATYQSIRMVPSCTNRRLAF